MAGTKRNQSSFDSRRVVGEYENDCLIFDVDQQE
jgi:hypothetical protein